MCQTGISVYNHEKYPSWKLVIIATQCNKLAFAIRAIINIMIISTHTHTYIHIYIHILTPRHQKVWETKNTEQERKCAPLLLLLWFIFVFVAVLYCYALCVFYVVFFGFRWNKDFKVYHRRMSSIFMFVCMRVSLCLNALVKQNDKEAYPTKYPNMCRDICSGIITNTHTFTHILHTHTHS